MPVYIGPRRHLLSRRGGAVADRYPSFTAQGATTPVYAGATSYSACQYNGKTYIGWGAYDRAPDHRFSNIRAYTHALDKFGRVYNVGPASGILADDDHDVPSICINADGRIIVAYGNHDGPLHLATSTNPEDETLWTTLTNGLNGLYSYPHLVLVGTTVYCTMRKNIAPGGSDGTTTFPSGAKVLVYRPITFVGATATVGAEVYIGNLGDNSRWYQGNQRLLANGRVAQVATRADYNDTFRVDVLYYEIDFAGAQLVNFAGAASAFPVNLTTMNASFRLRTTPGGSSVQIPKMTLDVESTPRTHIVYPEGVTGAADPPMFHLIGVSAAFTGPTAIGGGAVDGGQIVNEAGGQLGLYYNYDVAKTFGGTRNGNIYKKMLPAGGNATQWGASELLQELDPTRYPLGLVVAVFNGHPNMRTIWWESAASSADANSFPGKRGYAHGDNGFIGVSQPIAVQPAPWTGQGWWIEAHPDYCYSDTAMTTLSGVDGLVRAIRDRSGNNNHFILEGSEARSLRYDDGVYWLDMGDQGSPTTSFACAAFIGVANNGHWSLVGARTWQPSSATMDIMTLDDGSGGDRVFRLSMATTTLTVVPFTNTGTGIGFSETAAGTRYNDDFLLAQNVIGTAATGYKNGVQFGTLVVGSNPDPDAAIGRIGANATLAATSYIRGRVYIGIERAGNIDQNTQNADMAYALSKMPR